MSDTPRTDAHAKAGERYRDWPEHARQLERELAQIKAAAEALANFVRIVAESKITTWRGQAGKALAQWEAEALK